MKKFDGGMLFFAVLFFLIGSPLLYAAITDQIQVFWTKEGAILFQMLGLSAACVWGSWSIAKTERKCGT